MELDAEQFEQVVAALGPARDEVVPPGMAERRRDKRLAVSADVFVAPFGVASAKPRKVKLRSISRGGAAIVDEFTRPPGGKVVMFLPGRGGELLPVVCIIMNCRMSGAEFRIGMQFLSQSEAAGAQVTRNVRAIVNNVEVESPLQVLERIATHGVTHDGPDRRIELNVHGVMTRDAGDGQPGPATFVTVKDVSTAGGLSIVHAEEMRKGDRFLLQIPSQSRALKMVCTVAECRRIDETSVRIGAYFDVQDGSTGGGIFGRMRRWFAA